MKATFKQYIVILAMLISAPFVFSDSKDSPTDQIALSVTEAANTDSVSNEDLAIWYSIYRGTYLYGTKFNLDNAVNFGVVFDKQIKVRDTLVPNKTGKLKDVINGVFKKYEELPFDDNSKSKFLEECDSIAKGLRGAID